MEISQNKRILISSLKTLLTIAIGILGLFKIYSFYFYSNFDSMPGNQGDNRLFMAVSEHWYQVLIGQTGLWNASFFFPDKNTLTMGDGMFLTGIINAFYRLLGMNVHSSFQMSTLTMQLLCYFSFFGILKRHLNCSFWISLIGAFIYSYAQAFYDQTSQSQIMSVCYIPMMIFAMFEFWHQYKFDNKSFQTYALAIVVGLALPAIFFTSYYMAWFFTFFCCIGFLIAFARIFSSKNYRNEFLSIVKLKLLPFSNLKLFIKDNWTQISPFLISIFLTLSGLILFAVKYLPRKDSVIRNYNEIIQSVSPWFALFSPNKENFLWGWFTSKYALSMPVLPIPYLLAFSFICIAFYSFKKRNYSNEFKFFCLVTFTTLYCWILAVRFGDITLWKYIYHTVPGAKAIRMVFRIQFVLHFFVCLTVFYFFNYWLKSNHNNKTKALLGILIFGMILETGHPLPKETNWSKSYDQTILDRISPAPKECESFFFSRADNNNQPWIYIQTLPMIATSRLGIPTLNGYHGLLPYYWWGVHEIFNQQHYFEKIKFFAAHTSRKGLPINLKKVCSVDPITGEWNPFPI